MRRDPFGFTRWYYSVDGAHQGATLREVVREVGDRTLDDTAIAVHLGGNAFPADRTVFAAVRQLAPGYELVVGGASASNESPASAETRDERPPVELRSIEPRVERGDLGTTLRAAMREALQADSVIALSGGLDSAVLLALAHEIDPDVRAIVLAPQLPNYREVEGALTTARRLRIEPIVVDVTERAFLSAVLPAVRAFEVPLYNLHPVSKYLLARAAREHGFTRVISGDGADQVFTRDTSADYLPLASAAFDANHVELRAPFLEEAVVAHLLSLPPDPHKTALRELAATLPVSRELIDGPKISRFAPELVDDVRETTLALLLDSFGVTR